MSERKVIRFGLGEEGVVVAPLCRLWVQGDEAYLTVRVLARFAFRVSMHANGAWFLKDGHSTTKLSGPQPVRGNYVGRIAFCFPGYPPRERVPLPPREERIVPGAKLYEEPSLYEWRHFSLVFSARGRTPVDPEGADVETVGSLDLRSGGKLWLATYTEPMAAWWLQRIREERAKDHGRPSGDPFARVYALRVEDTPLGCHLIPIELGRESFSGDPLPGPARSGRFIW